MHRSREWPYERIRQDKRQNPEMSGRALAQTYRVSRNTVAKALRLEDFEFEKNPDVTPELIGELKKPVRVPEGRPLVLIGGHGTGRSHLLIGTDHRLCAAIADRPTFEGPLIQTGTAFSRLTMTEHGHRSAKRS
ncbi:hypothetical protein [Streptomyces sasae]|uniref:hypothetical protein n=1 Tax=Streptomyces sasae TaxID=1266772 RepID=UPI00292DAFF8|nr:hypothetical protein [Streptomyces sasae]